MKKNNKTLTNIFYGVSALLLAGLAAGAITALDYTNNPIIKDSGTTETCNCNNYHIAEDAIIYDLTTHWDFKSAYDSESYQAAVAAGHNKNTFVDMKDHQGQVLFAVSNNESDEVTLNPDLIYAVSLICSFDIDGFNDNEASLNAGSVYDFMGGDESIQESCYLYKSDMPVLDDSCEFSEFNFIKLPLFDMTCSTNYTFTLSLYEFEGEYFYADSIVFEPIGSSVQSTCYTSSNNQDSVEEVVDDEEENSSEEITYIEESPAIDSVLDWTLPR